MFLQPPELDTDNVAALVFPSLRRLLRRAHFLPTSLFKVPLALPRLVCLGTEPPVDACDALKAAYIA